jgi:hypothetical protein
MAVATGTVALAQHASWTRSASDQGSFTAGTAVRVDTPSPLAAGATAAITNAPGVQHAMAVYVQLAALPAEILAVNASQAADTVQIRPDQAGVPEAKLFGEITPKTTPSTRIPGRPAAITFSAALTPTGMPIRTGGIVPISTRQANAIARGLGPVGVTVAVADSNGDMYQLDAGTLPADGRNHVLTASLGGADVSYPLRLVQFALTCQMPPARAAALTLTVAGASLSGWHATATSPDLQNIRSDGAANGPTALPATKTWDAKGDTATLAFNSGFGQAMNYVGPPLPVEGQVALNAHAGRAIAPLPAIATSSFADANNIGAGSVVQATLNGQQVPLSIVAVVKTFPTVTDSSGRAHRRLAGCPAAARQPGNAASRRHRVVACRHRPPDPARPVPRAATGQCCHGRRSGHGCTDRRPALRRAAAGAARARRRGRTARDHRILGVDRRERPAASRRERAARRARRQPAHGGAATVPGEADAQRSVGCPRRHPRHGGREAARAGRHPDRRR